MPKLSVYIVTLNEEQRLGKTLKAAQEVADEIIVVDSGSTDKTEEIAKQYGAKFIFNEWKTYCWQKHFAETQCSFDWVLLLDADEVLSNKLIDEIKQIKSNPKFMAYKIKIADMLPNDVVPSRFARRFNPVRLYNKKIASMPADKMHKDRVDVPEDQKIGQLQAEIYHYSSLSITDTIEKYNRHSSELQKDLIKEGRHFSKLRLYTEYPRQFLRYYLAHGYIFRGADGFIYASLMAYFRFLKIAKWFEYQALHTNR
jgi:glycosyltransferase involved in cell wall biosynthesis